MRFGGVDIRTVHRCVSVNKEIPPGMADRDIETVGGWDGETYAGYATKRGQYIVRVNIGCHSALEAWQVRALLAQWARAGGNATQELEPTHWPGMAYDAICESISAPEFRFGFALVEIVFCLPRPIAHEIAPQQAEGNAEAVMLIGGSEACRPLISQAIASGCTGLVLRLDGAVFATLKGAFAAGSTVCVDMATGAVTLDGAHIESRIDFGACNWHPGFMPGRHAVTSTASGVLTARWHNEWA